MFEKLTAFIPKFQQTKNHGKWIIDEKNEGTRENPKHMPFVSYNREIDDFSDAVYSFIVEHDEMMSAVEESERKDLSSMNGAEVMALIFETIRAERFCEGILLNSIESGEMTKWLERLKEIDENPD